MSDHVLKTNHWVRQRRIGPAGGSVARGGSGTSPCREVGLASRFDKSEIRTVCPDPKWARGNLGRWDWLGVGMDVEWVLVVA